MEILGAFAPRRPEREPEELVCLYEARAELVSLGGIVLFAVCVLLSIGVYAATQMPTVTTLQRLIFTILTVAAWLYFIDSVSEQLRLVDHSVEYRSVLGRARIVKLEELDAMLLSFEGLSLEHGIETIEFRQRGKKPERIALGPCWQRKNLESFLQSVREALRSPDL